MPAKAKWAYFLALLLGVVLLATQLHCCVELNSATAGSHMCPICSAAGTAIATPSLAVAMVQATNPLELPAEMPKVSVVVLRNIGPRAPPAC
jgi:hypothetical protein